MTTQITESKFYKNIKDILQNARESAYRAVNSVMVMAYWNIGREIVEEEQRGNRRAGYGKYIIEGLSKQLSNDFGNGFSQQSLRNFRQFYLIYPIRSTVWSELSWSHYKLLIRVKNKAPREYYGKEAVQQRWSVRALDRQINSFYYERLLASKNKRPVRKEAEKHTIESSVKPEDLIKDPSVLEFLNMNPDLTYLEKEIEQGLIDKLQQFLLELGSGFSFVSRQHRISTETKEFYIDLVFYNYLLKCFVLVDVKSGELTHQDIGQMDMYVRVFEDKIKPQGDNPTIGIILCSKKDTTVVKYSVLNKSKRLFVSKYMLYLPTEEELMAELDRDRLLIEEAHREKVLMRPGSAVDKNIASLKSKVVV